MRHLGGLLLHGGSEPNSKTGKHELLLRAAALLFSLPAFCGRLFSASDASGGRAICGASGETAEETEKILL